MQGCSSGEKCTWLDAPDDSCGGSKFDCVPDGSVTLGGICTRGVPGATTGYDNCQAGLVCIGPDSGGECKDVCGFDGGADAGCPTGQACTPYLNLSANADEFPVIGACNATCGIGSCSAGQACYVLTLVSQDTIAVCAPAGTSIPPTLDRLGDYRR